MTFRDYWKGIQQKNSDLREGNKITTSVDNLKKLLEQAYTKGLDHATSKKPSNFLEDILDSPILRK